MKMNTSCLCPKLPWNSLNVAAEDSGDCDSFFFFFMTNCFIHKVDILIYFMFSGCLWTINTSLFGSPIICGIYLRRAKHCTSLKRILNPPLFSSFASSWLLPYIFTLQQGWFCLFLNSLFPFYFWQQLLFPHLSSSSVQLGAGCTPMF